MNRNQRRLAKKAEGRLKRQGDEPFAVAVAHHLAGRLDEAEASYRRALEIKPDHADAHSNLGFALQSLGRPEEAEASFRRALEIKPDLAEAHNNLGNILRDLGRLEEAEASCRRALEIKPDLAEAHCNLGNTVHDLGRLEEAEASYRRALKIKPDFAEAHSNLGNTLHELGRLEEAEASCRRALEIKPDFAEAHSNLGNTLRDLGRMEEALRSCLRVLRINETWGSKNLFVNCVKRAHFTHDDGDVRAALVRALSEPWGRPGDLVRAGAVLVTLNPDIRECVARSTKAWPQRLSAQELFTASSIAAVSADTLLRAILVSAPVCDIELERFLTLARHAMLAAATDAAANEDGGARLMDFHCALAQQCFINEYVFDWTADEANQARALRDSLIAALEAEAQVPILWLVAVASYFPLYSLPLSGRLLDRSWPEAVAAVLAQQIREPEEELQHRATIPRLTTIEDGVSHLVQQQYEENPYPRWIKAAPVNKPATFDIFLRRTFPLATFRPLGKVTDLDVLIAGCGTGQHSIDSVRQYTGARVLAVDLSLTSLCYAKRKTIALALGTVEYAQADIMKLGSLGRSFDVIEATGVLHHLADPMAGWRVLLALLRPGGFMRLGLYSEVARRDIVRGRTFIAEKNYGTTAEDIRQCRQELMTAGDGADFKSILHRGDFFSTSACRDLLFHVQEHRMTLDGIDAFLDENDLQFMGFYIDGQILHAYKLRFPDDRAATNLGQWRIFENENPDTFRSMYQFCVQKAGSARELNSGL